MCFVPITPARPAGTPCRAQLGEGACGRCDLGTLGRIVDGNPGCEPPLHTGVVEGNAFFPVVLLQITCAYVFVNGHRHGLFNRGF